MWALRVLSGPSAGQIHPLHAGRTTLGRGPLCTVKIQGDGVSKEHANVIVTDDKIIISDANSRNGTFVNGIRVQNHKLKSGDKVTLHDVFCEVIQVADNVVFPTQGAYVAQTFNGNAAMIIQASQQPHLMAVGAQMAAPVPQMTADQAPSGLKFELLKNQAETYFDNIVLPGVFQFAEKFEFRFVIGSFIALFIFIVTALTTLPLQSLIKESVQDEAGRRALTIARNMAQNNRQALLDNLEISVSTRQAELEEGVTSALIISSKDGHVIAPANQRGTGADKPFIHRARREDKEKVEQIDSSIVAASVPIAFYNPELGQQSTVAHAIVFYDSGSLAMNKGQVFSMFIQTLAIGGLLGAILFLFFIRLLEEPIRALNVQLDAALREGRDDLQTKFRFPLLQGLIGNINSALTRVGKPTDQGPREINPAEREPEAETIVDLVGYAAIAVSAIDQHIINSNAALDYLIRSTNPLRGRPLKDLPDSSLRQTIMEMIPTLRATPHQASRSEMPFEGHPHEVTGQAVMAGSEPAYFLIVVRKIEIEGGG